ncbi:Pyridoxine 5'-phosphate synthase [Poriferisphaera corsica]|uniref:Pyridoxine 5'-phosphate synthase n=1 Tax=Poriferisphaera corsica TaxID=2528020 RepID=A0A517YRC0_9BACT|nr:pyridoxine 5'-phosphate synthase [Poriferisphaera corsica]QDU32754.1 Pyridoxine 5'-phosphate synthase [Poriferisphaera corsica]
MTKLSVNVNKVAHLRNTRHMEVPSVTWAARTALDAGAVGVTVHPRPDERHIREYDVYAIQEVLKETAYAGREYNIEGNPFEGKYIELVTTVKPDQCTLVPDDPGAFTSNAGWKVSENRERLIEVIGDLKKHCGRVSLFMDADPDEIRLAKEVGADRVELYTEPYADAWGTDEQDNVLRRFIEASKAAQKAGLGLNAGHDLNLDNLGYLIQHIPWLDEVSIGHALIADALQTGLKESVKAYLNICNRFTG